MTDDTARPAAPAIPDAPQTGDKVTLTGEVVAVNTPYRWANVTFSDGSTVSVSWSALAAASSHQPTRDGERPHDPASCQVRAEGTATHQGIREAFEAGRAEERERLVRWMHNKAREYNQAAGDGPVLEGVRARQKQTARSLIDAIACLSAYGQLDTPAAATGEDT